MTMIDSIDPSAPTEENEPARVSAPARRYSRSAKVLLVIAIAIGGVGGWMIAAAITNLMRVPH